MWTLNRCQELTITTVTVLNPPDWFAVCVTIKVEIVNGGTRQTVTKWCFLPAHSSIAAFGHCGTNGARPQLTIARGTDCTTLAECCFTSTETVGLSGTGAQDVHLDFHTAPELCKHYLAMCVVHIIIISLPYR